MTTPQHSMAIQSAEKEEAREFVTRAVHDLREPLRAIRAGSELMIAGREPSDAEARCLGLIQNGADRIETLIRDIAEYCYTELRVPECMDANLTDVLNEGEREAFELVRQTGAVVSHDPLPAVHGDFMALSSVFRALIENACRFQGEQPPRIHVSARKSPSEWVISVQDNGRGFDQHYAELIFRPFERLEGKRYPGSGLGLARAKRVVDQHGGRIWAESKPGEGTTIRFTLPRSD
jgi:signal transduction histidine kinase